MRVDPRAERLVLWLAAVALALPIVFFRYPPMTDLPHHEACVALLRHLHDPTFAPPGLYELNLGHGNQLFHVLAWSLSYLLPLDLACKVVVAAIVAANVIFAGRLAHHLGASRWVALLVVPAVLGWLFFLGFAHNLLGLALLLAALPNLDHYCEQPTARGALRIAVFTIALHFAHESAMVIFAGAALVFACGYELDARRTLLRVAPFFLALSIALADMAWMKPLRGPAVATIPLVIIPVARKLATIPVILFGEYPLWLRLPLFGLATATVVLLAIERSRSEATPIPRSPRAFVRRYRFELFAAGAFACFLTFPATLNGACAVYQRFLAPAYVVAAIAAAPRKDASMGAPARLLACLVPILTLAAVWPVFQDSSRTHKALDRIIPLVAHGSAVAVVGLDPMDPGRMYLPSGAGARVLAERGGRLMPTFTESPNAPVTMNLRLRWNEPGARLTGAGDFIPSHDFRRFRYALVDTKYKGNAALAVAALSPEARLLASSGEFFLFESKLPVAPVTSPDVPMEEPRPESLFQRMRAIAAEWTASGKVGRGPPPR